MTAALVVTVIAVLGLARRVVADHERMRLIAEAEHELRGPLQAIALATEADARRPDPRRVDVRPELERARMALADLTAARSGRRADADSEAIRLDRLVWRAATGADLAARRAGGGVHLDWAAGPVTVRANRGRLAQALMNLLANAVEHGGGHVRVVGRRTTRGIRVEVRDSGRGHGLTIAAKAVRESGGRLTAAKAGAGMAVAIDLPITDAGPEAAQPHPDADPPAAQPLADADPAGARIAAQPLADADPPAAA